MFSGIISAIGNVEEINRASTTDTLVRVRLADQYEHFLSTVNMGGSISCSGVCLTVIDKDKMHFVANISDTTLRVTNLQFWQPGTPINLESSLKIGDPLDGHLVQGHVDGIARIFDIKPVAGSRLMEVECPPDLLKHISRKSSVTLEGVSLTVNSIEGNSFSINVIPYTWENTVLQYKKVGEYLNMEVDLISKYLDNLLKHHRISTERNF